MPARSSSACSSLPALLGPDAMLNRRVEERQQHDPRSSCPTSSTCSTISVEAGLGFEQALDRTIAAVPGPARPTSSPACWARSAPARRRADAMRALERARDVPEMRSFVLAILQADTFGVSIGRVLRAQADEMRIKRRQLAQEKAQKAPGEDAHPDGVLHLPGAVRRGARSRGHQHRHRPSDGRLCHGNGSRVGHPARGRGWQRRRCLGVAWQPTPATFIWLFALVWGLWHRARAARRQQPASPMSRRGGSSSTAASRTPTPTCSRRTSRRGSCRAGSRRSCTGRSCARGASRALLTLTAALTALLAVLVVRIARLPTASSPGRSSSRITLGVGASAWAERPFMFGLVFLARHPDRGREEASTRVGSCRRCTSGSTSTARSRLGCSPSCCSGLGRRLDKEDGTTEWRCLKWAAWACALAGLNPYGPEAPALPAVYLLQRNDVLRHIVEWQAPLVQLDIWQKLFLIQIAAAVIVLAARRAGASPCRSSCSSAAALVQRPQHPRGEPRADRSRRTVPEGRRRPQGRARLSSPLLAWVGTLTMGALCLLTLTTPVGTPSLDLRSYPVRALAYINDEGLLPPVDGSDGRLLAQDFRRQPA